MKKNENMEEVSSDFEQHIPNLNSESLEVDETAYSLLEHITLDWPTQSLCFLNPYSLLLGTNPDEDNIKDATFYAFDFSSTKDFTDMNKFLFKPIHYSNINRIRTTSIFDNSFKTRFTAISDTNVYLFNDYQLLYQQTTTEAFDYGLAMNSTNICFSKQGVLEIIDIETQKNLGSTKIHEKSINDIVFNNYSILTASDDFTMKSIDIRSNEIIFSAKFNCDVNAIDTNIKDTLICGLENGEIQIFDIRKNKREKTIQWHKSSITSLKFYNEEEFYSSSFEKCCLWDLDLEEIENWEYPNELVFEHAGDKQYKDMCINSIKEEEPVFAVCGEKGICLFSPIE